LKVSIVTVVFNGKHTIQRCIDSVLGQNHPDIEYIIVDGQSTDGTIELIKSYGTRITHFLSEKDHGIYDAMNKGIDLATGEVIGIINSDDFYANSEVISKVVKALNETSYDACYADLDYIDNLDSGKIIRHWRSGEYSTSSFKNGWMPPHPTFFVKRKCYLDFGKFRLDFGSAADYELMLRMIEKNGVKITYVPEVIVKMQTGGVSNVSFKNRIEANKNDRKAWKVNQLKPRFYTLYLKPLRKLLQFL
tara:strand:+ start:97 stop:840 length:744 start_codon:yes stop_codon:yes gene_type:complete